MTMRTLRWIFVLTVTAMPWSGASGGTNGPEQLGAHWAHVPDRMQLEFLLDGFRSAPRDGAAGRIMMRNAQAGKELQLVAPLARANAATLTVHGDAAVAEFAKYGRTGEVRFGRIPGGWRILSGTLPGVTASRSTAPLTAQATGISAGTTFMETPISSEHGIDRLSRSVTRTQLGRSLFATPGPTASYYTAHYTQDAPFVTTSYIQFVVDPVWNRIVYGNMDRWIKSYDNLMGPTSIAVDPSGRVFVGESGRQQVSVLRLDGDGDETQLRTAFSITGMSAPTAIALSDNGTPLEPGDDYLYVADAVKGVVLKYRLDAAGGTLVSSIGGFESPTAIATGRWNGANNGLVYVVDKVAKRLRVFEDGGASLAFLAEYDGGYDSYFNSVATDHFGNVYLADNTKSRLVKLSASLESLDEEGGGLYAALTALDIPFGRITIDGQGTYWAGFDQLFAVERWSDATGARRRTLGLGLKDVQFTTDSDVSTVAARFILTDFGTVGASVFDASGKLMRVLPSSAMVSGNKEFVWDRRDETGELVVPGDYTYELVAKNPYRDERTTVSARWTLPMYYEERSGSDEPHLLHGTPLHSGDLTVTQDDNSVRYRFTGLNPSSTYAVAAEYVAPDGVARSQDLTAGEGVRLHDPIAVGTTTTRVDFMPIPPVTFSSGELLLSVNRRGTGTAVVARIVLKETGQAFSSHPEDAARPARYALQQNYPNPFNPSTLIRFDLPETGPVSLTVYDIGGREVARLVNEVKSAGTHEIRFDATTAKGGGLASGVYFYRVRAGNFEQTRKMVLVK